MIKTVTITGADDSIDPEELVKLSEEFPFVEWGILFSRKQVGRPRFPSGAWLVRLYELDQVHALNLSMHLCGAYVREFLDGYPSFAKELTKLLLMFSRVQINTHGEPHTWSSQPVADFIGDNPQLVFIFQYDNVNTDLLEVLCRRGDLKNISALYDLSHGAGILPSEWPKPLSFCPVGYAGGLGSDNLESQIKLIEEIVGDTPIWIDMETKVRSFMGGVSSNVTKEIFDLKKVRACLETAKHFVK